MSAIPLSEVTVPEGAPYNFRIRGLVYCQAKVQHRDRDHKLIFEPWETEWKWCIGVWFAPRAFGRWDVAPAPNPGDPLQWFLPGFSAEPFVHVLEMRITHFSPLPDDPE